MSHSLSPAHVILGIKETPLDELLTDPVPSENVARTHIMFSHTHKGQSYNIPLLSRFLDSQSYTSRLECTKAPSSLLPTLIDWELITDDNEKRTVGFGWYAGGKCVLYSEHFFMRVTINCQSLVPLRGSSQRHSFILL